MPTVYHVRSIIIQNGYKWDEARCRRSNTVSTPSFIRVTDVDSFIVIGICRFVNSSALDHIQRRQSIINHRNAHAPFCACAFLFYFIFVLEGGGGHNSSLTPPPFNEVCVPSQGSERSCICVLKVSTLTLSTILIFEFGISHFIIRNIYISSFLQMISVEGDYIRR